MLSDSPKNQRLQQRAHSTINGKICIIEIEGFCQNFKEILQD